MAIPGKHTIRKITAAHRRRFARRLLDLAFASVLLVASGCELFEPHKRAVRRNTEALAAHLSAGRWKSALAFFADDFQWVNEDRRRFRNKAARFYIANIRRIKNRTEVRIRIGKLMQPTPLQVVVRADMGLTTVTKDVMDVSHTAWKCEMTWKHANRQWRLTQIRDLTPRSRRRVR